MPRKPAVTDYKADADLTAAEDAVNELLDGLVSDDTFDLAVEPVAEPAVEPAVEPVAEPEPTAGPASPVLTVAERTALEMQVGAETAAKYAAKQ